MIKGTTSTGFTFEIDEEVRDDYDLMNAFNKLDTGESGNIDAAVELMLGKAQKNKLREHCKGKSGRVLASKMEKEVVEIINLLKENPDVKN